MKKISIITGVYNEEETVSTVYNVIKELFLQLPQYEYEHIFMDNCSTDNTLAFLKEIAAHDNRVKILSYSKNFGPIKTEMIGFRHASGDAVISFEANLKDPPSLIPTFIKNWEEGYDVVYGVRTKVADNFVLAFLRRSFYRIVNLLSDEKIPENAGSFRLVSRPVVNELIALDDYKPYIRGLITSIGFRQKGIDYLRRQRPMGRSKSNFAYLFDHAINAITSYSIIPIRICTYAGLGIALLSFIAAFIYFLLKLFYWRAQIPAVSGLVIILLIVSGIQLFFLGVIGEYIGAIHSQVRKKPYVIIKEKINFP